MSRGFCRYSVTSLIVCFSVFPMYIYFSRSNSFARRWLYYYYYLLHVYEYYSRIIILLLLLLLFNPFSRLNGTQSQRSYQKCRREVREQHALRRKVSKTGRWRRPDNCGFDTITTLERRRPFVDTHVVRSYVQILYHVHRKAVVIRVVRRRRRVEHVIQHLRSTRVDFWYPWRENSPECPSLRLMLAVISSTGNILV